MEPMQKKTDGKFLIRCVCSAIRGSWVCWIRCQHSSVPDRACTTNRFVPTAGSWNCPCGNQAVDTRRSHQPSSSYKQRQENKLVITPQRQLQFIITYSKNAIFPPEKEFKMVPFNAVQSSKGPPRLFLDTLNQFWLMMTIADINDIIWPVPLELPSKGSIKMCISLLQLLLLPSFTSYKSQPKLPS